MSKLNDADYFSVRAAEERALSLSSRNKRVADAHCEMADRYERLADQFRVRRPRLHIVSSTDAVAS